MNTRNEEEEEEEKSIEKNHHHHHHHHPVKTSKKGKSCKGTLYYSSGLQSKAKNPRCIGIPRTLPHVPHSIVEESKVDASKDERHLKDFYYACAGYSVYLDQIGKEPSGDERTATELPVCVGLEFLVGKKAHTSAPAAAPTAPHVLNKQDAREVCQPQRPKPIHSPGTDFLTRFSRNADLVALGVWKNMGKVGNYMKESVSDILYPYRGRPKNEEEKSIEKNHPPPIKTSKKGKSCKGTLYYSTALRSKAKYPRCIGIPRSLPHVPRSIVEASKDEASDVERKYKDYCFVCAGFSVYLDQTGKEPSGDKRTFGAGTPLPAAAPTAAHALNKEDVHEVHQPQRPKRIHSTGTDFLTRNADLVPSGVWKNQNMGKVGN